MSDLTEKGVASLLSVKVCIKPFCFLSAVASLVFDFMLTKSTPKVQIRVTCLAEMGGENAQAFHLQVSCVNF